MNDTRLRTIPTDALPEVVTRYLAAHRDRDTATAVKAFTGDATVTDEDRTHSGSAEIEAWLDSAAREYTFTTTLTGAQQGDTDHYVAAQRLEGDFPGGVADLRYRFTLRDGLIERLVIAP
ncbi:nuclear transport factor 2 family protein [Streptomyces sp. FIT100]|uniref:nuclear transport factor 2 family protein n=1 Tax=Streptomyces sp. FIT100 TaxID=2837956 RepID=UPI0021C967C3|nr:nuclear transport factor 2 family protein [Streptomyces sp. FIT100]UUN30602.1 nuclear transport factor 2 family protein [Streptomyces sp. FIT100]